MLHSSWADTCEGSAARSCLVRVAALVAVLLLHAAPSSFTNASSAATGHVCTHTSPTPPPLLVPALRTPLSHATARARHALLPAINSSDNDGTYGYGSVVCTECFSAE